MKALSNWLSCLLGRHVYVAKPNGTGPVVWECINCGHRMIRPTQPPKGKLWLTGPSGR